jgi:hypothetical protein
MDCQAFRVRFLDKKYIEFVLGPKGEPGKSIPGQNGPPGFPGLKGEAVSLNHIHS